MKHEWREIPSLPGFEVNEVGDVVYSKMGHVRKPDVNAQGILKVCVTVDRVPTTRSVAVLVAEAFLTDPYPEQFNSIIHMNADRLDCRAVNLMRRPRSFAVRYHRQFADPRLDSPGLRGHHYHLLDTGERFASPREPAMKYGLLGTDILINTLNHERVWPGGYRFEFEKD